MFINSLFVYGSLAPGEKNEHFLKPLFGRWQTAYVHGELFKKGLAGTEGYPALILNEDAPLVKGKVFTCLQLLSVLKTLDDFEGAAYQRVTTTIHFANGTKKMAYVYAYNPPHI